MPTYPLGGPSLRSLLNIPPPALLIYGRCIAIALAATTAFYADIWRINLAGFTNSNYQNSGERYDFLKTSVSGQRYAKAIKVEHAVTIAAAFLSTILGIQILVGLSSRIRRSTVFYFLCAFADVALGVALLTVIIRLSPHIPHSVTPCNKAPTGESDDWRTVPGSGEYYPEEDPLWNATLSFPDFVTVLGASSRGGGRAICKAVVQSWIIGLCAAIYMLGLAGCSVGMIWWTRARRADGQHEKQETGTDAGSRRPTLF